MRIKETYEFRLPTWALSALINGDTSGCEEEDIAKIDAFEKRLNELGHGTLNISDDAPYFTRDNDICNLGADCVDATYTVFYD